MDGQKETCLKLLPKYEVVDYPKGDLFKCVICEGILRLPVKQITCGHRLCEQCLTEKIQSGTSTKCPGNFEECKDTDLTSRYQVFPDYGAERELKKKTIVKCPNKGCPCKIRLWDLEEHLGKKCSFKKVSSGKQQGFKTQDSASVPAKVVINAERNSGNPLKNREVSYIKDGENQLLEEKTDVKNHATETFKGEPSVPTEKHGTPCVKDHITDKTTGNISIRQDKHGTTMDGNLPSGPRESPTSVNETKIQTAVSDKFENNSPNHECVDHMVLKITNLERVVKENTEKIESLQLHRDQIENIVEIRQTIEQKIHRLEMTPEDILRECNASFLCQDEALSKISLELSKFENIGCYDGIFIWKVNEFERQSSGMEMRQSNPFFTSRCGYKCCVQIRFVEEKEDKLLKIQFCIMAGPHDENLKWPVRFSVTITLLEQPLPLHGESSSNYKVCFMPDPHSHSALRPTAMGNVFSDPQHTLCVKYADVTSQGNNFLKDDCIFIKVTVKDLETCAVAPITRGTCQLRHQQHETGFDQITGYLPRTDMASLL